MASTSADIQFPVGLADVQTPASAATLAVTITDLMTVLQPTAMAAAMTINLTIAAGVRAGARLLVIGLSDGTARTITFGTGFTSPVMTGVISKTKAIEFVYNGTTFVPTSVGIQID